MTCFLRAALIGLIFVVLGTAQTDKVTFGSIELRLGTSKAQVKAQIVDTYAIMNMPELWDSDLVMVLDGITHKMIGNLYFTGNKLTSIQRSWRNTSNTEAIGIGRAIYGLVSQLNEDGKTVATVKARAIRHPGFTIEIVEIGFGSRIIQISMRDGQIVERQIKDVEVSEYFTQVTAK